MAVNWEHLWSDSAKSLVASDIRDAFKLTERENVISFAGGLPSPDTFPRQEIWELCQELVFELGDLSFQYGPTEGYTDLRELIAAQMTQEGIPARRENILITSGSQQGLDLICKLLLNPGDGIIVELPGYVGGLGVIYGYQGKTLGIPLDDEGLRVDILEENLIRWKRQGVLPKLAYIVPNFQNPSGVTLSLERREKLLALAEEYGFIIMEDNPYGELRFSGESLPHMKSMPGGDHVIYLGSFSKVLMPGMRLAWICADETFINKLAVAKQSADLCSGSFGQKLISQWLQSGKASDHVQMLREMYQVRRDAMLQAMEKYFPAGVSWTQPQGGFFVWVTLPESMNAKELLPYAVEAGVGYVPGEGFHVDGRGQNTIRLAYSQASPAQIEEGIKRLGKVLDGHMERISCAG
ncbi:MAG: PLP-dependent aminotransferase family protein [Limnochordia bacterium]